MALTMVVGGGVVCLYKEPLGNLWFAGFMMVFSSPPLFLASVLPSYKRIVKALALFAAMGCTLLFILWCALVYMLQEWKAPTAAAYFALANICVGMSAVRTFYALMTIRHDAAALLDNMWQ